MNKETPLKMSISYHKPFGGSELPTRNSSLGSSWNETLLSSWRPSTAGHTSYGTSRSSNIWPTQNPVRNPTTCAMGRDMNVKRWDGVERKSESWDGLRRDPELWFPDGNCFVHLYGHGQSRRGPSFRVPFEALLATNCHPLLDRFMAESFAESPVSDISYQEDGGFFGQPSHRQYDLFIPAPPTAEREQAFLYHTATRNFFAWIFGRPLVGNHLGGALVGLLNSMHEFRSQGEDNVQALLDYMDEEGYADMRNVPDHALAVLFFAEHFQFKDLWIDAFAHCTGMNNILITSAGFEHMTRQTRAFITRSQFEMDMRLDDCGKKLSSFLSEELSEAYLDLTPGARAHLDKFRTFLHSFYVAKLGYYPPQAAVSGSATFPTSIYRQMRCEFQRLYDLLVDSNLGTGDSLPISKQGGICILQNTQNFDRRHKYESLVHPFPLLPESEDQSTPKPAIKRFGWVKKSDKIKPDERLVSFSSLTKATNRKSDYLYDCSLVRAYRGFEKECVFSPTKDDKNVSVTEARKVRWLLVYSVLQTLISATRVPDEVRDIHNVPYNLCVLTAGCPPWNTRRPIESLYRSQTDQSKEDYLNSFVGPAEPEFIAPEIKPDIDYSSRIRRPPPLSFKKGESTLSNFASRKGSVKRALRSLGSMPELQHPSPKHACFHEILIHGYGNGTNEVIHTAPVAPVEEKQKPSNNSVDSLDVVGLSSRWSNSSCGTNAVSSESSVSSHESRRGSDSSGISTYSHTDVLEQPLSGFGLRTVPSSLYSQSIYEPEPLQVRKHKPEDYDYYMTITTDVKVEYEERREEIEGFHKELVTCINA